MTINVMPAKPSDFKAVLALLAEAKLPTEGVRQHFTHFLVAFDDKQIIGCVGLEIYGDYALLRSLAVTPTWQGQGLGVQLTTEALTYAQANTVKHVVLLTTSAAEFFAQHFGFVLTERSRFNELLNVSPEWNLTVCASAVCMVLLLP
jgi:amino-acid N-acetyltransferase